LDDDLFLGCDLDLDLVVVVVDFLRADFDRFTDLDRDLLRELRALGVLLLLLPARCFLFTFVLILENIFDLAGTFLELD
jgi:hypothetical protein